MANYLDNGIEFKKILQPLINDGAPGPSASFIPEELENSGLNYYESRKNILASYPEEDIPLFFSSNAIDIHWGGAQVAGETLNTTGEVLSILQTAYNYATTYNVKYDEGKLYDDKGTEIKVGSDYELPTADASTLGGIKVGSGLSIATDGKLSVNSEYVTDTELTNKGYITKTTADSNYQPKGDYQPKGNYLTEIPSEYVTDTELTNKGYITSTTANNTFARLNHNHIGISNYKNNNKKSFDTGWYRLGYFCWSDTNFMSGSNSLILNMASDCFYRSSSVCGSIIQSATGNYQTAQAKIDIINASKYTDASSPVFDAIRTVKELVLPTVNAQEALKDTNTTYGHPAQVTYIDLHFTENTNAVDSLSNNVSYMFSGYENFVYDNTLTKIPAFTSNYEKINSKDGKKSAYVRRVITYKPIEYTSNDITTYLYFGDVDNGEGTYVYNDSSTPVRVGSSATIKPVTSEDVVYSTNDKTYITIAKQSDKSVKVTPTSSVTSSRKTTIYCTTASSSIVKTIEVYVDKANNAINSVTISTEEAITSAKDTGKYTATVSKTGEVGTLSYAWEITSGATYATITNANVNPVTLTAKNGTSSKQPVTLKCTVSSSVSGISSKFDTHSIEIPVGTTSGSINWAGDTLEYGKTAYLQTTGVTSTAYNDGIKEYSWSVDNDKLLKLDSTTNANVTVENINNTGSDVSCKVTCVVTFNSGLTRKMEKTINTKKLELKYYWYVGQTNPANLDESFNPEGIEGWTKLTSTPTSIPIAKETPDWSEVQWYLACPSEYGFDTTFNGIKVGGWDIFRNSVKIGGVMYDVWKAQSLTDTVYTTLMKV